MFLFHIYLETFLIFRDIISEKIFTKIAAGPALLSISGQARSCIFTLRFEIRYGYKPWPADPTVQHPMSQFPP